MLAVCDGIIAGDGVFFRLRRGEAIRLPRGQAAYALARGWALLS